MLKNIKMKMAAILLACVTCFTISVRADVFEQGKSLLNVGIGVGSPYYYSGSSSSVPPIHASYEYGVTDKIGVGGLIGYTSATWDPFSSLGGFGGSYTYQWKFSYLIIGARGTYHIYDTDNFDFYGGLMLGYDVATATFSTTDPTWNDPSNPFKATYVTPSVGGLAFGGYIGARYMFSENFGGFAELGYNIAYLSIGVSMKF